MIGNEFLLNLDAISNLTDDEFFRLCQDNDQYKIERDKNRNIIVMAPTSSETSEWNANLLFEIKNWCRKNNQAAVFDSSGGFIFPNDAILSPDITVIERNKWREVPKSEKQKFAKVVPDFVVEIKSISDANRVLSSKMQEYIENGVSVAWLIDPYQRVAIVYEKDREPRNHDDFSEPLPGSGIMAGFNVVLDEVFK